MKHLMLLSIFVLSACGANIPTEGEVRSLASSVIDPNSTYTYKVHGQGITFAAGVYANFGSAQQLETDTGNITIPDGNSVDVSIYGLNTVGQITYNAGAGTLTVEVYKNNVLMDTKTIAAAGNSVSFNIDIE